MRLSNLSFELLIKSQIENDVNDHALMTMLIFTKNDDWDETCS